MLWVPPSNVSTAFSSCRTDGAGAAHTTQTEGGGTVSAPSVFLLPKEIQCFREDPKSTGTAKVHPAFWGKDVLAHGLIEV